MIACHYLIVSVRCGSSVGNNRNSWTTDYTQWRSAVVGSHPQLRSAQSNRQTAMPLAIHTARSSVRRSQETIHVAWRHCHWEKKQLLRLLALSNKPLYDWSWLFVTKSFTALFSYCSSSGAGYKLELSIQWPSNIMLCTDCSPADSGYKCT